MPSYARAPRTRDSSDGPIKGGARCMRARGAHSAGGQRKKRGDFARSLGAVESITNADPSGRKRSKRIILERRTFRIIAVQVSHRLFFFRPLRYTPSTMSIRKGGGDWEPMLLGIEPRHCKVCNEGLYRNKTFFTGGWSRCASCDEFVHYTCLASGKVSFLKARPRLCKTCRAAQEGTPSPSPAKDETPAAVGS